MKINTSHIPIRKIHACMHALAIQIRLILVVKELIVVLQHYFHLLKHNDLHYNI